MDATSVHHAQLGATFKGVVADSYGEKISKFKGIKYANISARFERAQLVTAEQFNGKTIDATKYGCVSIVELKRWESAGNS
jgi:carboxylesterase type B